MRVLLQRWFCSTAWLRRHKLGLIRDVVHRGTSHRRLRRIAIGETSHMAPCPRFPPAASDRVTASRPTFHVTKRVVRTLQDFAVSIASLLLPRFPPFPAGPACKPGVHPLPVLSLAITLLPSRQLRTRDARNVIVAIGIHKVVLIGEIIVVVSRVCHETPRLVDDGHGDEALRVPATVDVEAASFAALVLKRCGWRGSQRRA